MGRTREFEDEAVLDRAGELFWRLGYEVVTIQDLESATRWLASPDGPPAARA